MEFSDLLNTTFLQTGTRVAITSLVGIIAIKVINKLISTFFDKLGGNISLSSKKARLGTLNSIVENIIRFLLFGILLVIIASDLGFNIAPILTGAGIVGLAVSFGAQSLVKDLISGFFLILDNQINVGDCVKIGDQEGKVVKILMRNIVLKDKKGNKVFIPNSEIKKIILYNFNNKK